WMPTISSASASAPPSWRSCRTCSWSVTMTSPATRSESTRAAARSNAASRSRTSPNASRTRWRAARRSWTSHDPRPPMTPPELWATGTDAVRALKAAYDPGGINLGLNLGAPAGGSVRQHLHLHVLPRWLGDTNFMTSTANTRMLPEALVDTAATLRAVWPHG